MHSAAVEQKESDLFIAVIDSVETCPLSLNSCAYFYIFYFYFFLLLTMFSMRDEGNFPNTTDACRLSHYSDQSRNGVHQGRG